MWYAITALIAVIVSAAITYVVTTGLMKKNADSKIGNAEEKARLFTYFFINLLIFYLFVNLYF